LIGSQVPAFAADVVYETDIKPILRDNCYGCHGPQQQMSSLRLDQRDAAMIAGRGKLVIVPGAPDRSQLYRRIAGVEKPQMPLTGPLKPEEIATIKTWIEQGAKWPDEPRPKLDWEPDPRMDRLFGAVRKGDFSVARAAVAADGNLVKARNPNGTTLLMHTSLYGSAADVAWLLKKGADPNVANLENATALMWALEDAAKVEALLGAGANPNVRSLDGRSPINLALDRKRSADVVRALLTHGAKIEADPGQAEPVVLAARNGDLESMKLLAPSGRKVSPLALSGAAAADCLECVQWIIGQGTDPVSAGDALRLGMIAARPEILNALLQAGANVNAKDGFGTTALMRASYSDFGDAERVKLLLGHGADVTARDQSGDTALMKARRKGASEIVDLLVQAGARD